MNTMVRKLCIILGLSFYWPLFRKSWNDSLWLHGGGTDEVWSAYYVFVIATLIITVLVALFHSRSVASHQAINITTLGLSLTLGIMGAILCFASLPLEISSILVIFDAILRAIVFVALTSIWAIVGISQDGRSLLIEVFISLAISSALMLSQALPYPAGIIPPLVFPFASTLFLIVIRQEIPGKSQLSTNWQNLPWGLIGTLVLSNFVVALLYGITPIEDTFSPNGMWIAIRFTSLAVSLAIVLLIWRSPQTDISLTRIWLVLTIVLIIAMFLAVIFSATFTELSKGLVLASQNCLMAFLWGVLVVSCQNNTTSPAVTLSIFYAALLALSGCIANAIGPLIAKIIPAGAESYLVAVTAFLTLILVLVAIAFLSRSVFQPHTSKKPEIEKEDDHTIEALLEETYDLTSREAQVATLFARGYSTQRVADTLFISSHTVQSHMKNIYRKLGIHKKQELIEIVEQKTQDWP